MPATIYVPFNPAWETDGVRAMHEYTKQFLGKRVAYTGTFCDAVARFYLSIFCDSDRAYPSFANTISQGRLMGVAAPTDSVDFIRFVLASAAHSTGVHAQFTEVTESATDVLYKAVLADCYRNFFVHERDVSRLTSDLVRIACVHALLIPRTYENITNLHALYTDVMRGRPPEFLHQYYELDPDVYPEQARDWALYSTNQQLRDYQQLAWMAATNSLAPDVLEEMLETWHTHPQSCFKNDPDLEQLARFQIRELIKRKRAALGIQQ